MRLNHNQMLAHWRRANALTSLRSDCTIENDEGAALDAALAIDMRLWYLGLLDKAEPRYLSPVNIAGRLGWRKVADGVQTAVLPADVRRLLWARAGGLPVAVTDSDGDGGRRRAALASNPYGRGSALAPVLLRDGNTLVLSGADNLTLTSLMAVTDPGDEVYVFDESALQLLPQAPTGAAAEWLQV